VRAHHKTLNGQLKNWRILSQVFCHHISMHRNVFLACGMLMQLAVKNGELLFEVEYKD
jgi:hypothetical protein